jgi:uncharacterized protein (DUF1499 family)
MARRRIAKEPTSRLAIWARRCAVFALAVTVLVIVIVRQGWIELDPSIAAVTGALGIAGAAIVLGLAAMVTIWREGIEGVRPALAAIVIGVGLLAYPAYLGVRYVRTPPIHDVTTDAGDPPRFDQVAKLRPRGTLDYAGAAVAARQRAAYPDIEPLQVNASVQLAFEAASSVVSKRKWNVILNRAPQTGRRDGQIEAVARTPILGFREDVVVRVRGAPDGARIDVRSASRYPGHDLGSNAARVRSLIDDIDDQVAVLIEERNKRAPPKPAPAKGPPQPARR